MLTWIPDFRRALDAHFGPKPRVGALATVDAAMRPRVRSVVCRRVDDDGTVWIASDTRSQKSRHVRANATVELLFWLASLREQYRLAGTAHVLHERAEREGVWREMSGESRALFFWPDPDEPAAPAGGAEVVRTVGPEVPPPDTFELLVIHPREVELLDVNPQPHRRVRWEAGREWAAREVNP